MKITKIAIQDFQLSMTIL